MILLAGEAKENRNSNALAEYRVTPSYTTIPIFASFRGDWGDAYTVVVGVHYYGDGNPNGAIIPTLAYYAGNGHGSVRLPRLTSNAGEVNIGGYWRVLDDGGDWSLFKKDIEERLRQHLRVANQ